MFCCFFSIFVIQPVSVIVYCLSSLSIPLYSVLFSVAVEWIKVIFYFAVGFLFNTSVAFVFYVIDVLSVLRCPLDIVQECIVVQAKP